MANVFDPGGRQEAAGPLIPPPTTSVRASDAGWAWGGGSAPLETLAGKAEPLPPASMGLGVGGQPPAQFPDTSHWGGASATWGMEDQMPALPTAPCA